MVTRIVLILDVYYVVLKDQKNMSRTLTLFTLTDWWLITTFRDTAVMRHGISEWDRSSIYSENIWHPVEIGLL